MPIQLTQAQIEVALPRVAEGLLQYLWLQSHLDGDARSDREFRRRFNRFYRVRRGSQWQDVFFELLQRAKETTPSFRSVLEGLQAATGRYEASFASKLLATVAPEYPVIDSVVLRNIGLSLPKRGAPDRMDRVCQVHATLVEQFAEYLATATGSRLVARFRQTFPDVPITEVKMLDLVLWQSR